LVNWWLVWGELLVWRRMAHSVIDIVFPHHKSEIQNGLGVALAFASPLTGLVEFVGWIPHAEARG